MACSIRRPQTDPEQTHEPRHIRPKTSLSRRGPHLHRREYPESLRTLQESGADFGKEDLSRLAPDFGAQGLGRAGLAEGLRRPGLDADPEIHLRRGAGVCRHRADPAVRHQHGAPVIQAFGTPEQKARFLPPTHDGDIWWCQGYSEPGAGSDLASLSTKAVRDGDHYIVNGQKTWTTLAQHADWGFFLVRTDPGAKSRPASASC